MFNAEPKRKGGFLKRIGIIGGLSWHSTAEYYHFINEEVNRRLGKQHSAELVVISLDFEPIINPWQEKRWDEALQPIIGAVKQLEKIGVDFFLISSNAVHKFAKEIMASTQLPMLHIVTPLIKEIKKYNLETVGLLGTNITMKSQFYSEILKKKGISVLIPQELDRYTIDKLLFDELVKGIFTDGTRAKFEDIVHDLKNKGAEGIILGCTEIPLLFSETKFKFDMPFFDTLKLHAFSAVENALQTK